jgi:high-affinity iron transporter
MRTPRWPWLLLVPLPLLLVAGLASATRSSKRLKDDERGEQLYDRHCIQCHGDGAAGNGPAASALVVPVPDLRETLDPDNREAMARVVLDGSGAMPGFEPSFDKYDARRVLRHMEKIGHDPSKAPKPRPVAPPPPPDTDED